MPGSRQEKELRRNGPLPNVCEVVVDRLKEKLASKTYAGGGEKIEGGTDDGMANQNRADAYV